MQVVFYIITFIIGACLGSFLCCQARRLHLKSTKKKSPGRRSVCLHCGHQLKWYENIPIFSWLIQKGKCRKCGKKIGTAEIISELATGLALTAILLAFYNSNHEFAFTIFGLFPVQLLAETTTFIGPFNWAILAFVAILALILIFLAIYDGLYGEMSSLCLTISVICAIIIAILRLWSLFSITGFIASPIIDTIFAVALLGGIYLVLYLVSKGKWVGDGDWILATAIAIVLGTPWFALITLFIANFSACFVALPSIKKNKNHKIFFGPFLVFAFILTFLIASYDIIDLW